MCSKWWLHLCTRLCEITLYFITLEPFDTYQEEGLPPNTQAESHIDDGMQMKCMCQPMSL